MHLARAVTGHDLIVKFEGGFDGKHDYAGTAVASPRPAEYARGRPFTAGTPQPPQETVVAVPDNDLESLELDMSPP